MSYAAEMSSACLACAYRIHRHTDVSMTLEFYGNARSTAASEALRRLGESL